jgi:hypothetical protein
LTALGFELRLSRLLGRDSYCLSHSAIPLCHILEHYKLCVEPLPSVDQQEPRSGLVSGVVEPLLSAGQ